MKSFIAVALFGALVASASLPNCDEQCKDTCCRNGGGDACVRACGCNEACPPLEFIVFDAATCQSDIEAAGGALTTAAVDVASAIKDCNKEGAPAKCTADISSVVTALGNATADINKAVTDCGGAGSKCVADISGATAALGTATTDVANAVNDCKASDKSACKKDIRGTFLAVAKTVSMIASAVTDCSS
jgi:hypothetical protein